MRWLAWLSFLAALACGGGASTQMSNMAARFAVFDCSVGSTDLDRGWCPVAAAGSGPFTVPDHTVTRLGLTLAIHPRDDPRDQILDHTTLSALYLGPDGARVIDIKPSNEAEMADLVQVVTTVAATLKGAPPGRVEIRADLEEYLASKATNLRPLTLDATGGTFQGMELPAEIERVEGEPWGAAYVVVEQSFGSADSVALVSVFPDTDPVVVP